MVKNVEHRLLLKHGINTTKEQDKQLAAEEIEIPYRISNRFIVEHRNYIFLFAHDVAGKGGMGQDWFAFGEPNCFAIPTVGKLCPSKRQYFSDSKFESYKKILDKAFSKIPVDGRPIIPFPKIGTGCSRLNTKAPKLFAYMLEQINKIKYPNIKIKYT